MTATAASPAVREGPILMSGPMVRATRDGRKTQTRRVVVPQPYFETAWGERTNDPKVIQYACTANNGGNWMWRDVCYGRFSSDLFTPPIISKCPFGAVGDRLWVRETWALENEGSPDPRVVWCADRAARYVEREYFSDGRPLWLSQFFWLASDYQPPARWRPSIHMPRWASRLTLEITAVRVERVQSISTHDIGAEGINLLNNHHGARNEFGELWDALNAKRGYSWDSNPWVWVLSFRRLDA